MIGNRSLLTDACLGLFTAQVHIPLDKQTKASKGLAFVSFSDPAHALAAYRAKDGSTFQAVCSTCSRLSTRTRLPTRTRRRRRSSRRAPTRRSRMRPRTSTGPCSTCRPTLCGLVDRRPARSEQVRQSSTRALTAGRTCGRAPRARRDAHHQETREFFSQEGINVDAFGTGAKAGGPTRRCW